MHGIIIIKNLKKFIVNIRRPFYEKCLVHYDEIDRCTRATVFVLLVSFLTSFYHAAQLGEWLGG